jgi:hypothetical protein
VNNPPNPLICDVHGCDALADWAYIGECGDMFLCAFHGGHDAVEGWVWIGEQSPLKECPVCGHEHYEPGELCPRCRQDLSDSVDAWHWQP